MDGLRPATEDEIVLAFLRGEIDSDRWARATIRALVDAGGLQLVRSPDLASGDENRARERALAASRGWRDREVFEGFPKTVDWYYGVLPPALLSRVRFIEYSYWNELSGGSRLPVDVLPTLRSGALPAWLTELGTDWCFEFAAELAMTDTVDGLVILATPDLSDLILVEGHARLTAIFVGGLQEHLTVRAFLGLSAATPLWSGF